MIHQEVGLLKSWPVSQKPTCWLKRNVRIVVKGMRLENNGSSEDIHKLTQSLFMDEVCLSNPSYLVILTQKNAKG